jgi:hypothetical protein
VSQSECDLRHATWDMQYLVDYTIVRTSVPLADATADSITVDGVSA